MFGGQGCNLIRLDRASNALWYTIDVLVYGVYLLRSIPHVACVAFNYCSEHMLSNLLTEWARQSNEKQLLRSTAELKGLRPALRYPAAEHVGSSLESENYRLIPSDSFCIQALRMKSGRPPKTAN